MNIFQQILRKVFKTESTPRIHGGGFATLQDIFPEYANRIDKTYSIGDSDSVDKRYYCDNRLVNIFGDKPPALHQTGRVSPPVKQVKSDRMEVIKVSGTMYMIPESGDRPTIYLKEVGNSEWLQELTKDYEPNGIRR